jgi:putative flavoprotein involved in K+ transport
MPRTSETIVIGAGQAGLSTSCLLTARGREHLVLERGQVGETWRSNAGTASTSTRRTGRSGSRVSSTRDEPDAFAPLAEVIGISRATPGLSRPGARWSRGVRPCVRTARASR